jgi:hypothetical protein
MNKSNIETLAKEITLAAIQSGKLIGARDGKIAAQNVADFYNVLISNLDNSNNEKSDK